MSPAAALSPPPERRLLAPAWRQKHRQHGEGEVSSSSSSSSSPPAVTPGDGNAVVPRRADVGVQQVDDDDAVETITDDQYHHFRNNHDSEEDDDNHEEDDDHEEYEEENQTLSKITTHVADWTLHTAAITTTTTTTTHYEHHQQSLNNINKSQEAEESSSDEDYHGEIESVATNEVNNNNKDNIKGLEEEDTFVHIITNEQQISLHPPSTTSPLVLVDLVALTGCMPTSAASKSILVSQLMESLLGISSSASRNNDDKLQNSNNEDSNSSNDNSNNQNYLGDGLSLHFNERVNELFESGVAYHIDSSYDIVKYCTTTTTTMVNYCDDGNDGVVNDESSMLRNHPYIIIPYPEFLTDEGSSSPLSQQSTKLRSTLRLWKLIHTLPTTTSVSITTYTTTNSTSPTTSVAKSQQQQQQQEKLQMNIIQLMKRIFNHLCNTSRSLIWRADMYIELCYIFNNEYQIIINKARHNEYKQWSNIERRLRLDKLYDIRETFVCQVGSVKQRYDILCKERESRVQIELVRRRRLRGETITIMTLSNICDFVVDDDYDNDGWGVETIHEDNIIGGGDDTTYYSDFVNDDNIDNIIKDDDDDDDDDEEWSPLEICMKKKLNPSGMHIVINGVDGSSATNIEETAVMKNDDTTTTIICQTNKLEPISHDENCQRISNRLLQQQNKWRQQQQDKDVIMTSPRHVSSSTITYNKHHQLVQSTWKEEEEIVRELLKTTDERIAEATLLKLEERLQNVDDLLESLQEEEWANDDEDEDKDEQEDVGQDDEIDSLSSSSLLDQILAMILGGISKEIIHIRSLSSSSLQLVGAAEDVLTNNITGEEHFRYIKDEHESIVKEWVQVFGRLPKICQHSLEEVEQTKKETAATLTTETNLNDMQQFGIAGGTVPKDYRSDDRQPCDNKNFTPIDNENSTWDEVEDWDALFP